MLTLLFWLLVGHALADYPLQGDFIAKAKNHRSPIPGVPWMHGLLWHAVIHGGAVALATGSVALGCAEIAAHTAIDFAKSEGLFYRRSLAPWYPDNPSKAAFGFHVDQLLHVVCKVLWAVLAAHGLGV